MFTVFRRCISLLLLLCLFAAAIPVQASGLSKEDRYGAALTELHRYFDGDDTIGLELLVQFYQELGNYKDSVAFWLYTTILWNVEQGDYSQLVSHTTLLRWNTDFCDLLAEEELPTVDELEAYALGRQAEAQGDLAAATGYYGQSINVLDSMMRLTQLPIQAQRTTPVPAHPTTKPASQPTTKSVVTSTTTTKPTPSPTPKPKPRTVVQTGLRIGDYYITTYSDNTCTITGFNGPAYSKYNSMIDLVIPSTLSGCKVTAIGARAFEKEKMIRSVTIPDGVTTIGEKAFYFCSAVKKIVLPETVTVIGKDAFYYCKNLSVINIPEGVTRLEATTFMFCHDLQTIVIPENVTYIGLDVFASCESLTVYVSEGSYAHEFFRNTSGNDFTLSVY